MLRKWGPSDDLRLGGEDQAGDEEVCEYGDSSDIELLREGMESG
jgi:hypothetical protein